MNFKLTEEQELIRKNIREFCVKNVEPIAAEIDEKESHPADLFKKLAEGGWMGIPIPTQYGGSGCRLPDQRHRRGGALALLLVHRVHRVDSCRHCLHADQPLRH